MNLPGHQQNDQMRRYGLLGDDPSSVQSGPPNLQQQEEDPLKKYEDFMNNLKQTMNAPSNNSIGNVLPGHAAQQMPNANHLSDSYRIEQLAATQANEAPGAAPREYDYLDYQENERRLRELTNQNASLMKYRTMLGYANDNNADIVPQS